jgi:integrase
MPARPEGVYTDSGGRWYFKVTVGRDPLTDQREQITRRGFRTAAEAAKERLAVLAKVRRGQIKPTKVAMTVDQLLDEYLDGIEADGRLSPKTCFDYRHYASYYVRHYLGDKRVRDVTPEVIQAWQRKLSKDGAIQSGKSLKANTVRLARAPLSGAFKLAVARGIVSVSPLVGTPRPQARRAIPKHWSPEQAREFLALMEGDRTWALWAFLMGSGLRIGELVPLRWSSVDLSGHTVRVVDFGSTLDHKVVPSAGKSRDAIRTIELDDTLEGVLRLQRELQKAEQSTETAYETTDIVFTKPGGGPYHPQRVSRLLATYSKELSLPRLTAHGLRHTSATLMLASGVPPKVAAERLGHADASLFMNVYSHVTQTMQRDAAARIGAALFSPAGTSA